MSDSGRKCFFVSFTLTFLNPFLHFLEIDCFQNGSSQLWKKRHNTSKLFDFLISCQPSIKNVLHTPVLMLVRQVLGRVLFIVQACCICLGLQE